MKHMNEFKMDQPTNGVDAKIEVIASFNGIYKPWKKESCDLEKFDNVELLSRSYNFDDCEMYDIFYAWDNSNKLAGKLFYGKWNNGIK